MKATMAESSLFLLLHTTSTSLSFRNSSHTAVHAAVPVLALDERSQSTRGMAKAKGKKGRGRNKKKGKPAPTATDATTNQSSASAAAAEYLSLWVLHQQTTEAAESQWKFSKTRQSFLLKCWPHRHRVSGPSFKQLLVYMGTLPSGTRQRTIVQAREVASSAESAESALEARLVDKQNDVENDNDDGDDDAEAPGSAAAIEERRAVLQIQRARAEKVLRVLSTQSSGELGGTV